MTLHAPLRRHRHSEIDHVAISRILDHARFRDRGVLLETEGMDLLTAAGIATPRRIEFVDAAHAAALPDSPLPGAGERVVLKAVAPHLLHKTESDAVRVVANRREAVVAEAHAMEQRLGDPPPTGFALYEFVPHRPGIGHEFLIGLHWTREFGPIVTLGPGGIHAEFLAHALDENRSTAICSPRLAHGAAAAEAAASIAAVQLATQRQRGRHADLSLSAVTQMVERFLALAEAFCPDPIAELEINPLVVSDGRLVALDALTILTRRHEPLPPARPLHKIHRLLEPRSIAVVGVSEKLNPGRMILQNILREGFDPARVTVVKPGAASIDGCRCVATLGELPEPVDLMVLSVAAAPAAALLAEIAATRKADSVVLIPGGLEEKIGAGTTVARMRDALARSRHTPWQGPVVNGGNCLGIRSRPGRYNTLFIPSHKLPASHGPASPVAFITASGAFAVSKTSKLSGVNPLYTITVGNQMDLTLADYLEYLMEDERIEVFACYLEGFKPLDGLRFFEAAREIGDRGRSVIVYRAGRTRAGAAAAASHTAAIAGNDAVFRALAAASGVVLADTLEDFEDLVRVFTRLRDRLPAGLRLGALSNAGFECVAIADRLGPFQLTSWTPETMARLGAVLERAHLEDIVSVRNPLDLTPILGDAEYEAAVRLVLEDPNVDVAVVGCVPLTGALATLSAGPYHDEDLRRPEGLVPRLLDLNEQVSKPWVAVVDAGPLYDPMALMLEQGGVPTFRTADRALRLFATWCANRLRALADRSVAAATWPSGRVPRA